MALGSPYPPPSKKESIMQNIKPKAILFKSTDDYNYRKLAAARNHAGISCPEAAEIMDCTIETLSRWENARSRMAIHRFFKYCEMVEIDPFRCAASFDGIQQMLEYIDMVKVNDQINNLNSERSSKANDLYGKHKVNRYQQSANE